MSKWYEKLPSGNENYVSSRIRLTRNLEGQKFPSMLTVPEATELIGRLTYGLNDIDEFDGRHYTFSIWDRINDIEKMAYRERRIVNGSAAQSKNPASLIVSDEEDVSILLNGDDHIRIQYLKAGFDLNGLWKQADAMDDYINSRFPYAFDEKYGYLTAFPTNVGTAMRANTVLHLPALSQTKQFGSLMAGLSRFGVTIRGVYGNGKENWGSLYDVCNSGTLGLSEQDIIDQVGKIARQLNEHETQAKSDAIKASRIAKEDTVYKSYGVLRYSRKISRKDALLYLSSVKEGIDDGIIAPLKSVNIYALMLGIQPYNLRREAVRPLDDEELDILRADYIRSNLPEIKEA